MADVASVSGCSKKSSDFGIVSKMPEERNEFSSRKGAKAQRVAGRVRFFHCSFALCAIYAKTAENEGVLTADGTRINTDDETDDPGSKEQDSKRFYSPKADCTA
jgi:hypothetical protein